MKIISLILLLQSLISNSFASDLKSRCKEYGLGWHFYCQDEQEESQDVEAQDHMEQLKLIKKNLKEKKVKAIIYPTKENIRDYMAYQKAVIDKASIFADSWRRVLWKSPDLDYTLKRPVSNVGKGAWIEARNKEVKNTIKQINEHYGIFFIFRSSCHFCHKYAPILKSFQRKYGISIMPISMDGGGLPNWDRFMVNNGQIQKLGMKIEAVPATILFDKRTKELIPIGFGVLSHSDLEERIYALTKLEVGDDF